MPNRQQTDRVLAIDVGTQSVRALVFDAEGRLCGRARASIEVPEPDPATGQVEQKPDMFWQVMVRACNRLWAEQPALSRRIAGVALTTQRATSVFMDTDGQPVGDAVSWLDQRRAECVPRLPWYWRAAISAIGARAIVDIFQRASPANWRAAHAPQQHARTHQALLLSGYLVYRLTGHWRDSVAAQVGYIPFDYRRRRWAASHDWKWAAVALTPDQVPELIEPGQQLGTLTDTAAAELGLASGVPLFSAGADKACEVLGAGALTPETACVSLGTTATINTCRDRYKEIKRHLPAYPAAMPDAYNDEVQIDRGFWLVSWFKQEFAVDTVSDAARQQRAPEALLDECIAPIAPGSEGLLVLPTWSPGVREPGPEARGAIVGFTAAHTRAHVYRAILEGLAYTLRDGREQIEARTRTPVTRLRVAGGGSQSDQAMQILADVFNLTAERSHTFETSGLGAAINAAVGLGWYADHRTAADAMVHSGACFTPNTDAVAIHERFYREVHAPLYGELKPTFKRIAAVVDGD